MLDKEKNDVYDLRKVIEYLPIQRGGGTGPMKPGNQRMHGANTCDIFAMMGFNVIISLVVRRGFFVINVRDYSKSDQVNGYYIIKRRTQ